MKKLLILMLVLGLASMANAGLVIKLYESDGVTLYDGRTLYPSDFLEIKLEAVGGNTGSSMWCLYALTADGIVGATGTTNIPPAPDASMLLGGAVVPNAVGGLVGEDGIVGTVGAYVALPPYADGIYFEDISFHCVSGLDVTLTLVDIQFTWDVTTGAPMDSVVIPQIPEPMTIGLLGLGGLFLRRRK